MQDSMKQHPITGGEEAPYMIFARVGRYDLVFKWHGGAYVDICWPNGQAFEVINVWDHEKDEPRIERTNDALRERVREWIDDPEMDREADLANYAYAR